MKFAPRLIVVDGSDGMAGHLESSNYWFIVESAPDATVQSSFETALQFTTDRLHNATVTHPRDLGLSLGSLLEQQRPFLPNKATEPAQHAPGYLARSIAELLAVDLILRGHERIKQGPHCVVLACAVLALPDQSLNNALWVDKVRLKTPGTHAQRYVAGFCCIQPDSGSGECFDMTVAHNQADWPAGSRMPDRLLELLDHWSIHPGRPGLTGRKSARG